MDGDGIPDDIDTDDDNDGIPDDSDWVLENNIAGKIWQVGETLLLSENFAGIETSRNQICYDENFNCELTIKIKIDMDRDCDGYECRTIDSNYPKIFSFTINILGANA
jgi:hypothetical protein